MKRLILFVALMLGGAYALGLAAEQVSQPPANPPKPMRVLMSPDPTNVLPPKTAAAEEPTGVAQLKRRIDRRKCLAGFADELEKRGKTTEAKLVRKLLRRPYRIVDGRLVNLLDTVESELAPCMPPQHQTDDGGIAWPAPGDWQSFFEILMKYLPQLIELLLMIFGGLPLFAFLSAGAFLMVLLL